METLNVLQADSPKEKNASAEDNTHEPETVKPKDHYVCPGLIYSKSAYNLRPALSLMNEIAIKNRLRPKTTYGIELDLKNLAASL
ncbi:hypothetical protein NDU88_002472 [Pleurodeles waltl]|uniref:Uncharacterized protein n=1 Tax=Pleurodeles waltl TaxID=8319 RepID=A0AAV7LCK4_PLEWA|nr:hypothetical protein NDU88_002472 [Pleurodeles waltl]